MKAVPAQQCQQESALPVSSTECSDGAYYRQTGRLAAISPGILKNEQDALVAKHTSVDDHKI